MTTKKPARSATRADGDETSARILDAAGPLFAATGYAETQSKAIAAAAGVDLASINYHFGNRNGLYQAVLADAHRRLIRLETLQQIVAEGGPAADRLARFIDLLVTAATGERSWPARVLARELLSPTSNARALLDTEIAPKIAVVQGLLSELSGIPVGDPALLRCAISVAAPCLMLLVVGEGLPAAIRPLLGGSPRVLAAHLHTFAVAGLAAAGRAHRDGDGRAPR